MDRYASIAAVALLLVLTTAAAFVPRRLRAKIVNRNNRAGAKA